MARQSAEAGWFISYSVRRSARPSVVSRADLMFELVDEDDDRVLRMDLAGSARGRALLDGLRKEAQLGNCPIFRFLGGRPGFGGDGPVLLSAWRLGAGGWVICRVRLRGAGGLSRLCVGRWVGSGRWGTLRRCLPVWTSWPARMTTRSRGGSGARIRWMRRFRCSPSFEARPGVPDRAFPWVSPAQGERMAVAWARLIAGSEAMSRARLLHLHHLTPLHDAVAAALPGVPVVTHLHGTELKMLDAIARAEPEISGLRMPSGGRRTCAERHAGRSRRSRSRPHDRSEAVRLLGIDPATVSLHPQRRRRRPLHPQRPSLRRAARRTGCGWLVSDPHGWDEATARRAASATPRQR